MRKVTREADDLRGKQWFFRILFYALGMVVLAMGITLNTKTGLGVSPLISVPYSIAVIFNWNTGNITLLYYILITFLQLAAAGRQRRWSDLLEIPFSIVFTRFMNLFSVLLDFSPNTIWEKLLILLFAIFFTGIGASMTVNARLIANPCDGFVHMLGKKTGKGMGFVKNIFDLVNVGAAFVIGLIGGQFLVGIGIGTICTMLFVGRVIALYNRLTAPLYARIKEPDHNSGC